MSNERRSWIVVVIGLGQGSIESVAHWNANKGEMIEVVESHEDDPDIDKLIKASRDVVKWLEDDWFGAELLDRCEPLRQLKEAVNSKHRPS